MISDYTRQSAICIRLSLIYILVIKPKDSCGFRQGCCCSWVRSDLSRAPLHVFIWWRWWLSLLTFNYNPILNEKLSMHSFPIRTQKYEAGFVSCKISKLKPSSGSSEISIKLCGPDLCSLLHWHSDRLHL